MRKGRWGDAAALFEASAQGIFADDPATLAGLAEAQLGGGNGAAAILTLDKLRAAHPATKNQDAHLLYAQALEAVGRYGDALNEYEAVSRYFAGFEARVRWGLLLLKQGQPARAHELFDEAVRASKVRESRHPPGQGVDQGCKVANALNVPLAGHPAPEQLARPPVSVAA